MRRVNRISSNNGPRRVSRRLLTHYHTVHTENTRRRGEHGVSSVRLRTDDTTEQYDTGVECCSRFDTDRPVKNRLGRTRRQ